MQELDLLNYKISDFYSSNLDFKGILEEKKIALANSLGYDSNLQIITLNIEHLKQASSNSAFKKVLEKSEVIIPDGESICLLCRIFAKKKIKKLAGIDLAKNLLDNYSRIAFLGAEETVLKKIEKDFLTKLPEFESKKYLFQNGFYEESREVDIVKTIAQFEPDLLLVALGSPRQELLIHRYRHLFKNCIMIGVGGSFDIFAGKLKRAPNIFIKLKLEWLFRILQEPERLRRFFSSVKYLLFLIIKEVMKEAKISL